MGMSVKKRLYNYSSIESEIVELNREIKLFNNIKYDTSITQSFNSNGGSSSDIKDKTLEQVLKIESKYNLQIEKNCKLIDTLLQEKEKLETAILQLEPLEKSIIRKRYFDRLNWGEIGAKENNISKTTLYRVHNTAIKKLEKIL